MSLDAQSLPRWDLSNIYSGLEGDDYRVAFARLEYLVGELEIFFDEHAIRRPAAPPTGAQPDQSSLIEEILTRVNEVCLLAETLSSFVYGYLTTDSYNDVATRETSRLEILDTRRQKLDVRLRGWLGSIAAELPAYIAGRPELEKHSYYLLDTARRSHYLMSEELESLAADLCLDGGSAFGKLQGAVTSQLKIPFQRNDRTEMLPITVVRNLSFDPNPALRERAYRAEVAGWASIKTTIAACLNSVKGTALTLARRRGWPSVLDWALDENKIDRATLDAMLGAIREELPMFRGYLRAKAKKLGLEQLRWWDLFAPVGGAHREFAWPEAEKFIVERFGAFSPGMGQFASRAFAGRWVDVGPRDGKRGGAYCMPVVGMDESRVLMNFDGSFDQVSTLAHELGHAFHNHCQTGLEPLRRGAPSTLAETASIFCETLIAEATLPHVDREEQLAILETQLSGATQVCVDILSRFLFESSVLERRQASDLSADEFSELLRQAQAATYAESVDPETYHPFMWLWKPHYYVHTENFYNFPYAFGHLFSLGLYAIFAREGAAFVPRYEQLLRSTGEERAAPLAARFGIDITQPDFWRGSLRVIADQARRFEEL